MKKYYILLLTALFLRATSFAQVTVTGGTNTTPALAATYTSLANAINALNTITSISGYVSISLIPGNPQTAPAGGYVIQFTATTTAANFVEIYGGTNTIAAFTPQTAGNLNDAIFKLVGVDHVYIIAFTLVENPSNGTTAVATNNMTEWGIALLRANTNNGCNNIHISFNTISLNRSYRNTFGIYSNVMHAATTPTVQADITSAAGSNSFDTIQNNTIINVDYGIVFIGSATPAFMDDGNKIGGTSTFDDNTISNWGGNAGTISAYALLGTDSYGIMAVNQVNENISWNTITSAAVSGGTFNFGAIFKNYSATPTGTISSTITYNTITLSSANASGNMNVITSQGITSALSTATIFITDNTIFNCVISGVGTSTSFTGITNSSIPGKLYITNNESRGHTSTATTGGFTGIINSGNVTDSITITGNKIGLNPSPAITFSAATTGTVNGISNAGAASTAIVNLNFNQFDQIIAVTTGQLFFLGNTGATGNSLNVISNVFGYISTLVTFSGAQSSSLLCVSVQNTTATCNVTIQTNTIRGIIHSVAGSATHQYITSAGAALNLVISDNIFVNLNVNTSGSVLFIVKSGVMPAGGTSTVNNNSITTAFNKPVAGGLVAFYQSSGASVNGSSMTETGNNFSNVTVNNAIQFQGWSNTEGISGANGPTKTITGNTFSNISAGSGAMAVIRTDLGAATNCSSNTITGISGTGSIYGILIGTSNGQGTHDYATNTINSLISSGTGGDVKGIVGGAPTITTLNINNNSINTFSSTGASSAITGIEVTGGSTININSNFLFSFTGTGTGAPTGNGFVISGGTTVNIFKNIIYTISENGAIATTSPAVNGMLFSGGSTITAYNNFVSNLRALNANLTDAIRVISVTSTTPASTYNFYYNSFNVAATSTGTNFGTTTLYHSASATATTARLNLVDNIFNNTSAVNGTGIAAAFRRSGTTLANYASTSDYNLFYAGTPAANRLIYYDGTNSDQLFSSFQTRVSTREANSLSLLPVFGSVSELHLSTTSNCAIDGRGTPIPGITTDIDNNTRDAVTPDMGADEINPFYFLNTLAGINGVAVCENKTVSPLGTVFANSSACNLIATVQSSGADPVAGKVNACVTLDATQQYFNAEPFVQRHYDIEPVTSNMTTTSATITLYFTDAEFVSFNTLNPAWPQLPTVAGGGSADPNKANLKVTQYHGVPTTTPSRPGFYTGNLGSGTYINPPDANIVWNNWYWAVTFDVTGFSGFYVHTNLYFPLPVNIVYFNGIKQGTDHLLSWKAGCNNGPDVVFSLERSTDGRNYAAIYSSTATAQLCRQPFNYTHTQPAPGINYYRLKITDANGKSSYSNVIGLLNKQHGFDIIGVLPNPVTASGMTSLNVTAAQAGELQLVVTDMVGKKLLTQSETLQAGSKQVAMNLSTLPTGIYQVTAFYSDGTKKTVRLVKQ